MPQDIRIKRSAVSGKIPQAADLELGELALNTHDGKLFALKDDTGSGGSVEVIEIGGGSGGGSTTFADLTDTPANYSGQANQVVAVNATEDALEFVNPGASTLEQLDDVDNDTTTNASDGDVLTYRESTGTWDAVTPVSGGGRATEWVRIEYTTGALVEELTWSSGITDVTLLTDNTSNSNLLIRITFEGSASLFPTPPASYYVYGYNWTSNNYNIVAIKNSGTFRAVPINGGIEPNPDPALVPNFGDGYYIEQIKIDQGATGASGSGQAFDFNRSHAYIVLGW